MSGCCGEDTKPFDGATPAYRAILRWVIIINAAAFVLLVGGAIAQGSAALSANALDFFLTPQPTPSAFGRLARAFRCGPTPRCSRAQASHFSD